MFSVNGVVLGVAMSGGEGSPGPCVALVLAAALRTAT